MNLQGVHITELRQIEDSRGAVLHMMRNDSPGFTFFGECYFSEIKPGAIKAWKRHYKQTQNLTVPIGRIRLVLFDSREFSRQANNLMILEVGRPDNFFRITIPPGVWYGFQNLSKYSSLIVNCTDIPHNPDDNEILDNSSLLIPYRWPEYNHNS